MKEFELKERNIKHLLVLTDADIHLTNDELADNTFYFFVNQGELFYRAKNTRPNYQHYDELQVFADEIPDWQELVALIKENQASNIRLLPEPYQTQLANFIAKKNLIPVIDINPPAEQFPFFTPDDTTPMLRQNKKQQIQHSLEWYRLIRNIPQEKLKKIIKIANDKSKDDIDDLLTALDSPQALWELISRNKEAGHVELTSFAACQQQLITVSQFSTVQMLCTGVNTYYRPFLKWGSDILAFQIYDKNGVKNNEAVTALRQSCKIFDSFTAKIYNDYQYTPTQRVQDKFNTFIDGIKNLPANEQTIFLIRRDHVDDSDQLVRKITGFGYIPFTSLKKDNKEFACFPSKGMMQLLLDTLFAKNASIMVSCLGNIEEADVANDGALGQRVFNMAFSFLNTPKTADGNPTTQVGFWLHDFYHNFIISAIPIEHREAYTRLYFIARNIFSDPDHTLDWIRDNNVSVAMQIVNPEALLADKTRLLLKNSKGTSLYTQLAVLILGNALESVNNQDIKKALANIPAHPGFELANFVITRLIDIEFSVYTNHFLGMTPNVSLRLVQTDFLYNLLYNLLQLYSNKKDNLSYVRNTLNRSIIIELICDIYSHLDDYSTVLAIQPKPNDFLAKLKTDVMNSNPPLAVYHALTEKLFSQKNLTKQQQVAIINEAIDSSVHVDRLTRSFGV